MKEWKGKMFYCSSVWSNTSNNNIKKLQLIQNFACKIITGSQKYDHVTPFLRQLNWLSVGEMLQVTILKFGYRFVDSPISLRLHEGLTLETSALRISVRWPTYIINSVDKTKFLYTTSPPTQHHSFFRNYPFQRNG